MAQSREPSPLNGALFHFVDPSSVSQGFVQHGMKMFLCNVRVSFAVEPGALHIRTIKSSADAQFQEKMRDHVQELRKINEEVKHLTRLIEVQLVACEEMQEGAVEEMARLTAAKGKHKQRIRELEHSGEVEVASEEVEHCATLRAGVMTQVSFLSTVLPLRRGVQKSAGLGLLFVAERR